ncbi:hypothetical protein CEY04_16075 [Achromobacter sp. HZ28]|nr:hypothetical protein CEY04_16075 [Achromobacter sp. HZ28]OWT78345.1 hypothetical protein CEY05_10570 [Achromobacter sp. HZ34]
MRAFGRADVRVAVLATANAATVPAATLVLASSGLLVPEDVLLDSTLHRAVVAHALAHLRYTPPALPAAGMKAMTLAVLSLLEDARVERLLGTALPGFARCLEAALFVDEAEPGLDFSSLALRLARAIARPGHADGNYWVEKGREGFERVWQAGGRRREDYTALGQMLANDLGQMRVRMDPDQYHRPRHRDDDSCLWDHPAMAQAATVALQSQDAVQPAQAAPSEHDPDDQSTPGERVPRPSPVPAARESAEVRDTGDTTAPETEAGEQFHYPEWHHRAGLLRENWCRLEDIAPASLPTSPATSASASLSASSAAQPASSSPASPRGRRRRLLRLPQGQNLDRAHRLRRQWEGETLDINAVIDAAVARRGAIMPDPRVFITPGRRARHISVLVLLDLSESANDRGQDGHRLLDREREAASMLAAAADAAGHRVAVHGFQSNTRHAVRYVRLLEFGQPLDALACARIDGQEAAWSTRLGTALRHATGRLRMESAARRAAGRPRMETATRRAILVVTDGAPSDIDVHDPRHLVEDTRVAIAEARGLGIRCHCLAVDGQAVDDVRRMFGARGYDIVADPAALPTRLARAFGRLLL